jgi:hypothetical protein
MVRGGPGGEAQLVTVRAAAAVMAVAVAVHVAAVVDGGARTVRAVEGCGGTVRRWMVAVARCGGGG